MPTYSYRCTECSTAFDIQQAFTDDALTACPACQGKLRKLFSVTGVTFNGSGFYRTDSRAAAGKGSGESAGSNGSGEKKSSGSDSSGSGGSSGSGSSGSGSSGSGSSGSGSSGSGSSGSGSSSSAAPAAAG